MSKAQTPIIISLKNRYSGESRNSSRRKDPAPPPPRAESPPPRPAAPEKEAATAPQDAPRSRSRSMRRAAERSRSPAAAPARRSAEAERSSSPAAAPVSPRDLSPKRDEAPNSAAAKPSILNRQGLDDIFARFHGEFDKWLQAESSKLQQSQERGSGARESLSGSADSVCAFLQDHAPQTFSDLGANPEMEGFASKTLPRFFDVVEEDRRALEETTKMLAALADRRFPDNEDLIALKKEDSPLELLKTILPLLTGANDEPSSRPRRGSRDIADNAPADAPAGRRRRRGRKSADNGADDAPASQEPPARHRRGSRDSAKGAPASREASPRSRRGDKDGADDAAVAPASPVAALASPSVSPSP